MDSNYLDRKRREIGVIDACLRQPHAPRAPTTVREAVDLKFRIAASLRAERSLESWALTETARPEVRRWRCGAYQFSFGYQRADLSVRGPPIYPCLVERAARRATLYAGSGMSALAALVTAALRLHERMEVSLPPGVYGESRELLSSLGPRILTRSYRRTGNSPADEKTARILWIDSCVPSGFDDFASLDPSTFDLVIFDTTCLWRTSSKIRRVVEWSARQGLPIVMARSHAKLDCLGIEYGRLGSLAFGWPDTRKCAEMPALVREAGKSIRLLGIAALPLHFPPFTGDPMYFRCTVERIAATLRNTRHMVRRLRTTHAATRRVRAFQHNLYLTLAPTEDHPIGEVRRAVSALCMRLGSQGLMVRHAGSFGFDFASVDWFPDPLSRRNVIRFAPGDLPRDEIDRIVDDIDRWWSGDGLLRDPTRIARARESLRATIA